MPRKPTQEKLDKIEASYIMFTREKLESIILETNDKLRKLERNIKSILNSISRPRKCNACGTEVFWVTTKAGKNIPYTAEGMNHYADCENVGQINVITSKFPRY